MSTHTPQEVETALFVCANDAPAICERLARLRELCGYRLEPRAAQAIHDTYYDSAEHALAHKRVGLRVRQVDARTLLTLKASGHANRWGGTTRLEREVSWSAEGLQTITDQLHALGIMLPAAPPAADAHEALRALGLRAIQDRETQRTVRNVLAADGATLAELAIDAMTYHFADAPVHGYEVELEEKGDAPPELLKQLVDALVAQFAPALRRWPHSKLATGVALAQLLRSHTRASLVDARNQLLPSACDQIDALLRGGDARGAAQP